MSRLRICPVWKTAIIGSMRSTRIAIVPTRSMPKRCGPGSDSNCWPVSIAASASSIAISIRLEWIEEFLALPGLTDGHFWRIEQTLYALCSSRYGAELLPQEYDVSLEAGIPPRIFRHYVGAIRHLMYGEGIAHLVQDRFLDRCQWTREAATGSSSVQLSSLRR